MNCGQLPQPEVDNLLAAFAANVRRLRTRPGCSLSRGELARVTQLPPRLIARIERGEVDPQVTTLGILAGGLGATLDDLVQGLYYPPRRQRMGGRGSLSQGELARVTQLPASLIARIERGEVDPHLTTLVVLAKGLNATLSDVVDGLGPLRARRDKRTETQRFVTDA